MNNRKRIVSLFDGEKVEADLSLYLEGLRRELVSQILSTVSNIKHKGILMLIYSTGLRVSEVVKLKP